MTRNLEIGSHWPGFINLALSASVQLLWTFPQDCNVLVVAPTIMSAIKTKRKKENRKKKQEHQLCLPLYQEGKYFQKPYSKLPLGFTVQSWVNFHLDKIRILLERKSMANPKHRIDSLCPSRS